MNTFKRVVRASVLAGAVAGLAACATSSPEQAARPARTRTASTPAPPKPVARRAPMAPEERLQGGRYKVGAPYEVGGLWYVPADQPGYDQIGVASWYGDEFDGKPTANGERFDMFAATAAHATLPMPAIVEVTNLANGRTIRVRLNDRGPFKAGRIIDVSRGAAEQLGFLEKGTAEVRVRYVGPARLDRELEPLYVATAPLPRLVPEAAPLTIGPFARMPQAKPAAPPVAAPATGAFAVQAGAFSDRDRAERVARSLASAGAASIRPLDRPSGRLYRVLVGPYDVIRAQSARAEVASLGFADAKVVEF